MQVVDLTLREGEEYPDGISSTDRKLAFAERIIARGFRQLEVGYAGIIEEHARLVRELKHRWPELRIISHARAYAREGEWEREIQRAADAGCHMLTLVASASRVGLAATPWLVKSEVPTRIQRCIRSAKSLGLSVAFGLIDPIRTLRADLIASYQAAAAAGAERLYLYDGVGGATPEVMAGLVASLRRAAGPAPLIGVHYHNTLGLATANAVAAVLAGAVVVDASLLGLGDCGGITATEELVTILRVLYEIETGIALKDLKALCEEVAAFFQLDIPGYKSIVGRNLYRHQNENHIQAVVRGHWHFCELVRADVLGHSRRIELAPSKIRPGRSGAVAAILERRGLSVTDDQFTLIVEEIRQQGTSHQFLADSEVEEIAERVLSSKRQAGS